MGNIYSALLCVKNTLLSKCIPLYCLLLACEHGEAIHSGWLRERECVCVGRVGGEE